MSKWNQFGAVARIKEMDALYEKLSGAFSITPGICLESEELKCAYERLSEYLTSGDWLRDYELDEQGKLPPGLKLGVLSEDGLYNLLCDLRELKEPQRR